MRIAVTGATGLIGIHSIDRLLAAGRRIRAFVRDRDRLAAALAPFGRDVAEVEVALGDVSDARAVDSALDGCDGLLHCAGVFSASLGDEARLEAVNVEGTRRVLEAAVEAGVSRIVYVSSILALFPPKGLRIRADDAIGTPRSMYAATKARAEGVARALQAAGAPVLIVYPGACHGPNDPTYSTGPRLVADALRNGRVLVTQGGLAYTDVRDLADLIVALFRAADPPARSMGPSFFLSHERYHALLEELTGRVLRAQRIPGWLLRALGRVGDAAQRLNVPFALTSEAAEVLTRSVPMDDASARCLLGRAPRDAEASLGDLLCWMCSAGHLDATSVGRLAGGAGATSR